MNSISQMPLVETLFAAAQERFSFHMPGNRHGKSFPGWLRDNLWSLDTTELAQTGDIQNPTGKVQQAMDLAASFFGAGHTRFVTTGTTTSLLTALATACPYGSELILPRRVHQTLLHGTALLNLTPIWAEIREGEQVEQALLRTLKANPQARALFVTSPGYDGRTVCLTELVQLADRCGTIIIVDEAHGSHFAAAPDLLPPSALAQGADLVAMSAHKTLPALTPASYLHIGHKALATGKIKADKLGQMLKVFQTSSPSFVIAATLDYARWWLEHHGRRAVENLLALIAALDRSLPPAIKRIQLPGSDPLRLTYDYSRTGLSRPQVNAIFDAGRVDPELVDLTRIILIPALDTTQDETKALAAVLQTVGSTAPGTVPVQIDPAAIAEEALFDQAPPSAVPCSAVLFGDLKKTAIPLHEADGRIAAEAIVPYPPGIALIWPGEIITADRIRAIKRFLAADITVYGVRDPDSGSVVVLE